MEPVHWERGQICIKPIYIMFFANYTSQKASGWQEGEGRWKMPKQPSQREQDKTPPSPSRPMARTVASIVHPQQPILCPPSLSLRAHRVSNYFWGQGFG